MATESSSVTAWGSGSTLSPRDAEVVELVGRFRQLSAEDIRELLFFEQRAMSGWKPPSWIHGGPEA